MPNHAEQLAQELNLSLKNVQGAIDLIDAGNTIPFIARYRKEACRLLFCRFGGGTAAG